MWTRLKKRILQLFTEEEISEQANDNQGSKNNSTQYKSEPRQINHKYQRSERSFRFPVIPDNPSEFTQTNDPYEKHHQKKQQEKQVRQRELLRTYETITPLQPKQTNKPFVPSRVASPIYGYNKRTDTQTIEQVPTFMRNKQTKQHKPLDDERVTPLTKDNEPNQAKNFADKHHSLKTRASNHNNDEQLAQKTRGEAIETNDHVENLSKNNADRKHDQASKHSKHKSANQEANDSRKQITPEDKHIPPRVNNEVKHDHAPMAMQHHEKASTHASQTNDLKQRKRRAKTNKDRKRHKNRLTMNQTSKKRTPAKQTTNQVPFNVMMTPGDYRSLDKKSSNKNNYQVPLHLLNDPEQKSTDDDDWVLEQMEILEQTLKHFKVAAEVVNVTQGPTVTRFEVKPAIGVKVSRVRNLSDDIKLNMAAKDIRIEAPIPGKNTIGIEIPNVYPQMVSLQEILQTDEYQQTNKSLAIGLGLNVEGEPLVTSINKMPHGLIAGATGSGKSVCINTILLSLIFKESYNDLKLLLIDPKMVELAPYNDIPHLVSPVITDVKAATAALKWAVNEMEDRYDKFVNEGVRDINRYNEKMAEEGKNDAKLPYIVIVIDELADLMMVSPQDVEDAICRIAQKARAAGMHLLIATQRPSVDVITGLIKANIPTRIAFSVSSQVDSRTILDVNGAERLLGKGDMLFVENGSGKGVRLQGAFVSDEEIERITTYLRKLAPAKYMFEQEQLLKQLELDEAEDELFVEAIMFIMEQNQASTSMLQRRFRIGYNRAARLIDSLEEKGIISGPKGSKPRQVLMSEEQLAEIINR